LENNLYFEADAFESGYNVLTEGNDTSIGIIACGIAYNYLIEIIRIMESPILY